MPSAPARPGRWRAASRIATLGPSDTDAATLAARLAGSIHLVADFRAAMEYACLEEAAALVPCGYVARTEDGVQETWTDLHFEFSDRLRVDACWSEPTRPMCLAVSDRGTTGGTIVTHAATKWFANRFATGSKVHYVSNKPDAARLCAEGRFDMCIASVDVVRATPALRILRTFAPEMVWVLYTRKPHAPSIPATPVA
jgi:hypothetical protein